MYNTLGTGWLPDYPDHRDYGQDHEAVKGLFDRLLAVERTNLPDAYDLSEFCSPIENQESIGSCTAHAAIGLLEYFERRAHKKHIDASRLFLYKATRNLLGWNGDTGAFLRTVMGALTMVGAPPERYWPYDIKKFDEEPGQFVYSVAQNFKAVKYARLDTMTTSKPELLEKIKRNICEGLPSMFGFSVFNSISHASNNGGIIPFPAKGERQTGGHAIMCVGFNDNCKTKNRIDNKEYTGALKIRNSWGTGWGNRGYGWLPYEYVLRGLATDWWTLINSDWVDTGEFGLQ